jgi:hypothetical protein
MALKINIEKFKNVYNYLAKSFVENVEFGRG